MGGMLIQRLTRLTYERKALASGVYESTGG